MYRNDFTPSSKSNISRQCTSEVRFNFRNRYSAILQMLIFFQGKTFHKPFKIKMTPSRKLAPLSDGKKERKILIDYLSVIKIFKNWITKKFQKFFQKKSLSLF